jgi:hypothetical protein
VGLIAAKDNVIKQALERKEENLKIISKLKNVLATKILKKKSLQMKNLALEHSIKTGENFVLSLDKFFCISLQEELLDNYVRNSVFNDIVTKKEAHKNNLIMFRNAYENSLKVEK